MRSPAISARIVRSRFSWRRCDDKKRWLPLGRGNALKMSSVLLGYTGNSAGSSALLCRHRLSGLESKGWTPRTKGAFLYTLASRLQKQKEKLNPYMLACIFLTRSLSLPSPTSATRPSRFSSWSFYLCYAILSPPTLLEHRPLSFLVLLPATIFLVNWMMWFSWHLTTPCCVPSVGFGEKIWRG
jgi:hypothetical protein